ncbi:hypothetical protein AB1Y20_008831 [Prymnesium parvum]|uniref:EF-hand domain-containing protein n=1 Tax=Prymnesium parvum TaxID=97485 RepID=A0AB34IRL5_PRYPA
MSGWQAIAEKVVVRAKGELNRKVHVDTSVSDWDEGKIRSATPHQRSLLYRLVRIDEDGGGTVDAAEVKSLEEDINSICEGLNNYWTAVGVVSALIMSITVPYCLEGPGIGDFILDDNISDHARQILAFFFCGLMYFASILQLMSIATSVHLYIHLTILMVDAEDKLWFMINNNIVIPQFFLVTGLMCFLVALPLGIFIVYGQSTGIVACGGLVLVVLYFIFFSIRYTKKSYNYLDRKILRLSNGSLSKQAPLESSNT